MRDLGTIRSACILHADGPQLATECRFADSRQPVGAPYPLVHRTPRLLVPDRTRSHPEAFVVVPVVGPFPFADGRGAVVDSIISVPTAATDYSARACVRSDGIFYRELGIIAIPIRTSFPDIAVHVIKSPRVAFLGSHRMGFFV